MREARAQILFDLSSECLEYFTAFFPLPKTVFFIFFIKYDLGSYQHSAL